MANTSKNSLKAFGREFISFSAFVKASKAGDEFGERISKAGDKTRAFSFYDDETISIPNGDNLQVDVRDRDYKGVKYSFIWISAISSTRGDLWIPVFSLRGLPTIKEQQEFFKESPLSDEMTDPSLVQNDIDRIERLLGRSFQVNFAKGYHADRFDQVDGKTVRVEGGKDFFGFTFKEVKSSIK